MSKRTYTDKFTLDGRLHPQKGATPKAVSEARTLLMAAMNGDYEADAKLRRRVTAEAYTTSDLAPAIAQLVNLQTIPQLDEEDYPVAQIASTRTVKDFNPAVLYSLYGNLEGPGLDANGAPVRVPEGTPYPTVTVSGQESFYSKLAKRGLRFDYTWEAQINDTAGFFDGLPNEIVSLAKDAAYAEVFDALDTATTAVALQGGALPNDVTVVKNAPISPDAIWEALYELSIREINGVPIGELTGYNVLVPVGRKRWIEYELNKQIVSFDEGNLTFSGASYYQEALRNITIIESPRVKGTAWKILPKPGATRRPSLELLKLRGYENPELRVRNDGGDSSFDTDTKAFRLRFVVGGALWDEKYVLTSTGAGA